MIVKILVVNIDAESGNLMDMVSDGKTTAHATEFSSHDMSVNTGISSQYLSHVSMNNC